MAITRTILVAFAIAVIAIGAAFVIYLSSGSTTKQIKTVNVDIPLYTVSSGHRFSPKNITVVIGINNTVKWTNDDTFTHAFVQGTPVPVAPGSAGSCGQEYPAAVKCPASTPLFDSGNLKQTDTFTFTFNTPGVYEYFDVYVSIGLMNGFVVVKQ